MTKTPSKGKGKTAQPRELLSPSRVEKHMESDKDAQAIIKRFFEARFQPLPELKPATKVNENVFEPEEEELSDWDGISDAGDSAEIETVEHITALPKASMSKEELKRFMSSKPPTETTSRSSSKALKSKPALEDDPSEAANLKKDLALQRLLAESHLLESSSNPTLTGVNRHKATDLRLQSLGAKNSILAQKRMPIAMRKGIVSKKYELDEKRRREAKENGIILEIAKGKNNKKTGGKDIGKRDRGVGAPAVGRFKGGTLTLSKKDIHEIEGPKRTAGGRSGRGGLKSKASRALMQPQTSSR